MLSNWASFSATLSSFNRSFSFSNDSCSALLLSSDFLNASFLASSLFSSVVTFVFNMFRSCSTDFKRSSACVFSVFICSNELILAFTISVFCSKLLIFSSLVARSFSNSEILFLSSSVLSLVTISFFR